MSAIPRALAALRPDGGAALQAAILAGTPFIVVPGGMEGRAALDAAAAGLAMEAVVFIRVGASAAALSVGRIMVQLAGDGMEGDGDDAARVMRALAARGKGASHLVVTVDGADTLAPAALSFLQLLPGLRIPDVPRIQVVFAGDAGFSALLDDDRFRAVRDAAVSGAPAPPRPIPSSPARPRPKLPLPQLAGTVAAALVAVAVGSSVPHRSLSSQRPEAAALATPVVQAAPPLLAPPASAATPPAPPLPAPPLPAQPSPAPPSPAPPSPVPPSPALEPAAAAPLASPSGTDNAAQPRFDEVATERARLRRQFDAFLASRGPSSRRLSLAERDALFNEYLAREQAPLPRPAAASLHVLVRYAAGSEQAEADARRLAALMQGQVAAADLLPAPAGSAAATIRYFFPADRAAALALAAATPVSGGEWQVEDASTMPTRPEPGTVEAWLPH